MHRTVFGQRHIARAAVDAYREDFVGGIAHMAEYITRYRVAALAEHHAQTRATVHQCVGTTVNAQCVAHRGAVGPSHRRERIAEVARGCGQRTVGCRAIGQIALIDRDRR